MKTPLQQPTTQRRCSKKVPSHLKKETHGEYSPWVYVQSKRDQWKILIAL
jgi:hypothetical protein